MTTAQTDILIIGAGPAGITAAVQVKRSGWEPLLVEKDRIGGALLNAHRVENYPGVPPDISGSALVKRLENHLKDFNIGVRNLEIRHLSRGSDHFIARYDGGEIRSKAVIVASGCRPRRLGIPGEVELKDGAVFYERRDMPDDLHGDICIIGGGDAAFDYALALSERNRRVTICMRSRRPRCLHRLHKRVLENDTIRILSPVEPKSLTGDERSGGIVVHFRQDGLPSLRCNAVLIAVGRDPADDFVADPLREMKTDGLLGFAGDVVNGSFRQVGIAVGDGLRCAMEITEILNAKYRL
jgi:thioredoxin reductase